MLHSTSDSEVLRCRSGAVPDFMPVTVPGLQRTVFTLRCARDTQHLLRQRVQDARPAADALVETFEVKFFVGRMDPVVVERETDQQ